MREHRAALCQRVNVRHARLAAIGDSKSEKPASSTRMTTMFGRCAAGVRRLRLRWRCERKQRRRDPCRSFHGPPPRFADYGIIGAKIHPTNMSESGETRSAARAIFVGMNLDAETCHAACVAKDRRFDGRFYVGVTSTGIYCRCICPARTPKRENRTFWPSAAAAEAAGFRPCLICRPERAPGLAPIDAPARLAAAAYARIEAGALEEQGLEALADGLGVTSRHLRRVINAQFGAQPD